MQLQRSAKMEKPYTWTLLGGQMTALLCRVQFRQAGRCAETMLRQRWNTYRIESDICDHLQSGRWRASASFVLAWFPLSKSLSTFPNWSRQLRQLRTKHRTTRVWLSLLLSTASGRTSPAFPVLGFITIKHLLYFHFIYTNTTRSLRNSQPFFSIRARRNEFHKSFQY